MILKHKPFCISLEYTRINATVQDEEIKQEISCLKIWQHRIENIRNKTSEIFGIQLPALQANTDEGKHLMSVTNF